MTWRSTAFSCSSTSLQQRSSHSRPPSHTTCAWSSIAAMSASIQRMGDLARHVAQQVRIRFPESAVPEGFEQIFKDMTTAAVRISHAIRETRVRAGLEAVPTIDDLDESIDTLHLAVFTKIAGSNLNPSQVADVTLLSRYLERFGDHAVSIAQRIEYLLTGEWKSELIPGDHG